MVYSVTFNADLVDSATRSSANPGFVVPYRSKSEYSSRGAIMSNIKRIFIIGHSGAGKGVLAQAVAKKLGWKFINADVLGCAAHIGRTVSEVVGTEGERAFNRCLTEILSHQITKENVVVTTDESIICDDKARESDRTREAGGLTVVSSPKGCHC